MTGVLSDRKVHNSVRNLEQSRRLQPIGPARVESQAGASAGPRPQASYNAHREMGDGPGTRLLLRGPDQGSRSSVRVESRAGAIVTHYPRGLLRQRRTRTAPDGGSRASVRR